MTRSDRRSLALHREVVRRITADPTLIERARERVRAWLRDGSVHRHYADAWLGLLDGDFESLLRSLEEESEKMNDLRQVSPFAGALDAKTRWAILREARS